MNWLLRFLINAIVLYLIAKYVPGFNHNVTIWTAVIAAIVFGLVNMLIGPILRLLSAPLTWLTHGLFSIVVNYILFAITVWIAPNFHTTGEISPVAGQSLRRHHHDDRFDPHAARKPERGSSSHLAAIVNAPDA